MKTTLSLVAAGIFLTALGTGFGQPVITTQPQNQTNVVGTTATFWVEATNSAPLAYQWQKFVAASWSDLTDRTNATLVLTNVQSSDAADYRVAVTNVDGATNSDVAHLYVITPPQITPTITLQHQAVHVGSNAMFAVTASGTEPLGYQWRLDGHDLSDQTNSTISFNPVQPADEGDYTVVVTNIAGAATSEPARLWVVPPPSAFIRGDYTNGTFRYPYYYLMPTNYNPARSYPLICFFHGACGDEYWFTNRGGCSLSDQWLGYANSANTKVFASYRQQATDPAIVVWPTLRRGNSWSILYVRQTTNLLDNFISRFNIDTNRVYVGGLSGGLPSAWDFLAQRPGFVAGAMVLAGESGNTPATSLKNIPLWAFCAKDDEFTSFPSAVRGFVGSLRRAGGNPLYTEYASGGHAPAIGLGMSTPAAVDWLLAQRRGVAPTNEPLLAITSPTLQAVLLTGATNLNLAGSAAALGRDVVRVTWTNFANNAKGLAAGTNLWSVTNILLVASKTNVITMDGTTTSWAPAFGGNTTFNDTLTVACYPIRATLVSQEANALLSWTGGGPPYRVQRATDLTAGDWTDFLMNVVPPVSLPLDGAAGFYRIVGQ